MVHIGLGTINKRNHYGAHGLDITAKSAGPIGKAFAPSWSIVMGFKNRRITWDQYVEQYRAQMRASYRKNWLAWDTVMRMDEVYFLCYCHDENRCHRTLLRDMFVCMGAKPI